MPPFEGFLEKAALEAGEGSSHENWNTLACTKFVPDADFSEVSQFGAKEVKVAKEIGSEDKKKKSSSPLNSTLVLLTQGLALLPTTIHYHKKRKWE